MGDEEWRSTQAVRMTCAVAWHDSAGCLGSDYAVQVGELSQNRRADCILRLCSFKYSVVLHNIKMVKRAKELDSRLRVASVCGT